MSLLAGRDDPELGEGGLCSAAEANSISSPMSMDSSSEFSEAWGL